MWYMRKKPSSSRLPSSWGAFSVKRQDISREEARKDIEAHIASFLKVVVDSHVLQLAFTLVLALDQPF